MSHLTADELDCIGRATEPAAVRSWLKIATRIL